MPHTAPYTETGVMQVAPDGTIFAAFYYEPPQGGGHVGYDAYMDIEHNITTSRDGTWDIMYSTDDGFTWESTNLTGLVDDDPYDYADETSQTPVSIHTSPGWGEGAPVFVATLNGDVYRIEDRGTGRSTGLTPPISTGRMYDMDIWLQNGTHYIAVAADQDVFIMAEGQFAGWTSMDIDGGMAVEVSFCRNFDETELIWAVSQDADTGNLKLTSTRGAGNWGNTVAEVEFENAAGDPHPWTPFVDIEFGSNYTAAYPELFVAVAEEYDSSGGNLYHVIGEYENIDPGSTQALPVLPEDRSVGSVAVSGDSIITIESWTGTVLSSRDGGNTFREAGRSPAAPFWGHVYMAPDFNRTGTAYVGVSDYYSHEGVSGVYRTTDGGLHWDGVSRLDIQFDDIKDMAFKPGESTPALMLVSYNGVDYIFYTGDAASETPGWLLRDSGASLELNSIAMLSWDRDGDTVVLAGYDGDDWLLYRSGDDGNSFDYWRRVPDAVGVPVDWVVVDSSTVNLIGNAFWETRAVGPGRTRASLDGVPVEGVSIDRRGGTIAAGMAGGYIAVSTDGGSSWKAARPYIDETSTRIDGDVLVALGPDGTLYAAAEADGDTVLMTVAKEQEGLPATTLKDNLGEGSSASATGFSGLLVSPDDTLYAVSSGSVSSPGTASGAHLFRLLVGERDNSWDLKPVTGGAGLWGTYTSNTLWTVVDGAGLHALEDTLTGRVVNVSAVEVDLDPSSVEKTINVSWDHIPGAEAYEIYFDDGREVIKEEVPVEEDAPGGFSHNAKVPGLKYATTYRITVRALEGEPLQSRFSTPAVRLTTIWHILHPEPEVPYHGMQDASLAPSFVWLPAEGAVRYEIQLTTDPGFAIPNLTAFVQNITATGYTYEARDLKYDTNYYWRVRSVAPDGSKSYWSPIQNFHTTLKPIEIPDPPDINVTYTTPPPLTISPPPPQEVAVDAVPAVTLTQTEKDLPTPSLVVPERPVPLYVWVVVVVGGVLVGVIAYLIYWTGRRR